MNWLPYVVVLVLLGGLLLFSFRNRRRQMAEEMVRADRIGIGTEVMTTSGLYGTVTAKNDDGSVQLSIAPGVEVKWASAALRDAAALSDNYRRGFPPAGHNQPSDESPGVNLGKPGDGDEPTRS